MSAPCANCKRDVPGLRLNGLCVPCSNEADAARELRHRCYVLAGTKRDDEVKRVAAIKAHEDAAVAFALLRLARLHGAA